MEDEEETNVFCGGRGEGAGSSGGTFDVRSGLCPGSVRALLRFLLGAHGPYLETLRASWRPWGPLGCLLDDSWGLWGSVLGPLGGFLGRSWRSWLKKKGVFFPRPAPLGG